MIKRKELVDYANSKKAQALRLTIENKNYIYLEAINALCQCGFAIRANKKPNIEAFKLSEKAFDAMYQFGYEQFLANTIESNLAICYINILAYGEMNNITLGFNSIKPISFYKVMNATMPVILINQFELGNNYRFVNRVLFQLECLASQWNIDLHFFVDATLSNMEYNFKNRI